MCSMLTIKTSKRRQQGRSGVFIVNFEHISHLCLLFLFIDFAEIYEEAHCCPLNFI